MNIKKRVVLPGFARRLIGQILIDGGFISRKTLKKALELQKHTNEQIGTILVHMGVLDRSDLEAALSLQRHLSSLKDSVKIAAGIRQLLGDLLTQTNRITHKQLELALEEQKQTGEKIGVILVRHGFITERELESVLAFQKQQAINHAKKTSPLRLGEILVTTGQITRKQLEDALLQQKLSKKKIGQILIETGYAKPEQVSHGLRLQHMLLTASLAAALSIAALSPQATHAGSADTKFTVSARVLARTQVKTLHQVPQVTITSADIHRGYVELKSASRIEVKSNNPAGYMLTFHGISWPFKEIHIHGLSNEVHMNTDHAFIHQPYTRGPVTIELSYRLMLSDNAKPGTYSWPLSIASQPI